MSRNRALRSLLVSGALAFLAPSALAQRSGAAAAEALFQDGRALFREGKFAEACPKLAESQRLDPATGTLLALALCHEQERKFATAWADFAEVEARARREGRQDRVDVAREHGAALKLRLSSLLVEVSPELQSVAGLEVRVDGTAIGVGSFNVALPVDGGDHLVEATAPGKVAFKKTFAVKAESDAVRARVPMLEAESGAASASSSATSPTPSAPQAAVGADGSSSVAPGPSSSGSGMRVAGVVSGGAGLVLVGAGSVLALLAKSKYDEAKPDCKGTVCDSGPYDDIQAARSQGTIATVLMVAGGAAIATGATLWFLAPKTREQTPPTASGLKLQRVGLGMGSAVLEGSF